MICDVEMGELYIFVVMLISTIIFAQSNEIDENKKCSQRVGDVIINLNELYSPTGYVVSSGNRTFGINICGFAPKCGLHIAACEIIGKQIIPLGHYSKLTFLQKYKPNIGLKYSLNTRRDNYTTVEFKCNRHIKKYLFKFVSEKQPGRHYRFTFESVFLCLHKKVDCLIKDVYYGTQIDLGPLYKRNSNWLVKNLPANSKMYLNMCGDLNPIEPVQKSKGAEVYLIDTSKNVGKSLGVLSQTLTKTESVVSATFSDGFECSKDKYSSTRIDFLCSFDEKGPELSSNTSCDYFIKWLTPNACPHKISTYDRCTFHDDILGQVDLTKLYLGAREARVAKDTLLKFNICGSLDSCNGEKDVSFCLIQNGTEIVYGKTSPTIISEDGFMRIVFQSNDPNRIVILNFICDYSQQIREEINQMEANKIKINIHTHLACPNYNASAMNCKMKTVDGTHFDLSDFALFGHNLEATDSDDPNVTYVFQICTPVIYIENAMCDRSSICIRNNSEPDLYHRFKKLSSFSEKASIYTKNNSVVVHHNGLLCPYDSKQSDYIIEIELRCTNKSYSLPILKSKSICTYMFVWETEHACSVIDHFQTNETNEAVSSIDIQLNNDNSVTTTTTTTTENQATGTEFPKTMVELESDNETPPIRVESFVKEHGKLVEIDSNSRDEIMKNITPTPENVASHKHNNRVNTEIVDVKMVLRSLHVPINVTNANGININNCIVTNNAHKFNMNSLAHLVNVTTNSGTTYTIHMCDNITDDSCQKPLCIQDALTNLILIPNRRFISMNFFGKSKCNDGYYNSVLFMKCSENAQQPSVIKEEECSVHLEWKNKETCAFFDFEDNAKESQTLSGPTTAAIVVPIILLIVSLSIFMIYYWKKKQHAAGIHTPIRCYDRIHYTRVKDSAKIV